jgi:hypothetical protein
LDCDIISLILEVISKVMKVFLSYSIKDKLWAKKIGSTLRDNGLEVWDADTEILPGDDWGHRISSALKDSDAMVVLISPDSIESQAVRREIEYALGEKSYNGRLIPVLIGPEKNFTEENIPWILQHLNIFRLTKPDQSEKGMFKLAQTLKEIV